MKWKNLFIKPIGSILAKLRRQPKVCKPATLDPTDWQTIVKIVIAVLTLLGSLLGDQNHGSEKATTNPGESEEPPDVPE
ncbi:MAG: hypothetical protein IJ789_04555 [Bacteroidales bacterium]|nr:hypothetical protein [Bacteroidales bacterium]